jgi:hypothetical protein
MKKIMMYIFLLIAVIGFLFFFAGSCTKNTHNDLVGEWLFDGDANDSSGNNNHGTAYGNNTAYKNGKIGQAVGFVEKTDFVEIVSDNDDPTGWTKLTVAGWVRLNELTMYGPIINRSHYTVSTPVVGDAQYELSAGGLWFGTFHIQFSNTDESQMETVVSSFQPITNVWYHIAGVYNGTTLKYYVNGILNESKDISISNINKGICSIPSPKTHIGMPESCKDWTDCYTNGLIDTVRVYNRALDSAEIRALYEEGN